MADLTPDQQKVKTDASLGVEKGLRDGVAEFLIKKYDLLKIAYPDLQDAKQLTTDDFRAMANQAIDDKNPDPAKRAITFKTKDNKTVTITLDDINEKIMKNPDAPDAAQFITSRGANHLSQLVFTKAQIAAITHEAGEVALENTGSKLTGGTTVGNAAKGVLRSTLSIIKIPFGGEEKNAHRIPAAESVRTGIVTRLKALSKKDPALKMIIGDGTITGGNGNDGDIVNQIGQGMYEAVRSPKPEGAKEDDRLASIAPEDTGDAIRNTVRQRLYDKAYGDTHKAVTERVEHDVDAIRNGGGIMGFIFKIAEFFGMEKWLVGLMGSPIPSEAEIQAVSHQVATSVSDTMTSKDFKYKDQSIPQMRNADNVALLNEAVTSQVHATLSANHAATASFKPEHLQEIARLAGQGISAKDTLGQIPNLPDPAERVAIKAKREGAVTNTVGEAKSAEPHPEGGHKSEVPLAMGSKSHKRTK